MEKKTAGTIVHGVSALEFTRYEGFGFRGLRLLSSQIVGCVVQFRFCGIYWLFSGLERAIKIEVHFRRLDLEDP